jgi:Domain of unknown function (DUF4386)
MNKAPSPRLTGRIAGLLYLIVVAASVYALTATSSLIVGDDAAATAANIQASEQVFRLAFVANLVAGVAYVGVVAMLYELFKPVNATLSLVAAFLGLGGCAISGATMLNQLAALAFLGDVSYLAAFNPEQLEALARVSLRLGGLGNSISLVFFGFYCLSLGFLVFGARFMPRVLGAFLVVAGIGWLVGNLSSFLAPSLGWDSYLLPVSGLGEFAFTLWLLLMGVNEAKWREQAVPT